MKLSKLLFAVFLTAVFISASWAQVKPKPTPTVNNAPSVKSSAAFSEVLLRKTELAAELESLLVEYTEEFPRVKDLRAELGFLEKELARILAVNPNDSGKLNIALGKLMIRKAELQTDLWKLQKDYNDEHPDVKSAKRKVEMFENAIKEILQAK